MGCCGNVRNGMERSVSWKVTKGNGNGIISTCFQDKKLQKKSLVEEETKKY